MSVLMLSRNKLGFRRTIPKYPSSPFKDSMGSSRMGAHLEPLISGRGASVDRQVKRK